MAISHLPYFPRLGSPTRSGGDSHAAPSPGFHGFSFMTPRRTRLLRIQRCRRPAGNSWDLSSSTTYLFPHATACGLRRTFPSKPIMDVLVLPSAIVKTLGIRENLISKLYQHFRERDLPYGLRDSLSTLHLFCSPTSLLTPPQAQDSIRAGG